MRNGLNSPPIVSHMDCIINKIIFGKSRRPAQVHHICVTVVSFFFAYNIGIYLHIHTLEHIITTYTGMCTAEESFPSVSSNIFIVL
jgi:hypothetical protein